MRLAVSNLAWSRPDDARAAAILVGAGAAGIELAPTKVWPEPLEVAPAAVRAYRSFWSEHGLEVVALQALLYGHPELVLFEGPRARRALLARLDGMAALAELLGAPVLVFGAPANRRRGELSAEAAREIATAFFREAGSLCADRGVVICIEPNPPESGCDFVTTLREGVELVRLVDSPGVRLHLDSAALTLAGDQPAELVAAMPLLHHFHVSEPGLAPIGSGGVDHAGFGRALAAAGYCGWRSLELKEAGLDELRRSLALGAACYAGEHRAA
jgi:sugar phosphate isomerase/epimerase